MKKSNVMILVFLCILVLGVFTTRLTKDFVNSASDAESAAPAVEAALFQEAEEAETALREKEQELPVEEMAPYVAVPDEDHMEEIAVEEEEPQAPEETVKSPLEPAAGPQYPAGLKEAETDGDRSYTYDEYKNRLDEVTATVEKYCENMENSASSAYLAAEFSLSKWDGELSFLSRYLRDRMKPDEAEKFRQDELLWIRERDQNAEQTAQKAESKSAGSAFYLESVAGQNRERCYELAGLYEEYFEADGDSSENQEIKE